MQTEHLLLGLQCHHFQNQEETEDLKEHPFPLRSVNSDLTGGVLLLQERAATGGEETCDGICWSWSTEICCMGWKLTACQSFEAVPKKMTMHVTQKETKKEKLPSLLTTLECPSSTLYWQSLTLCELAEEQYL